MTKPRLDYVELPNAAGGKTKTFYEKAFGWSLTTFAPTYHATTTGDVDIGLQGDTREVAAAPLPVIQVPDLEASEAAIRAAGGIILGPITAFPGGRRFHFRDPAGNELAAWQVVAPTDGSDHVPTTRDL